MTLAELQKNYRDKLSEIYDEREARAITKIVLEKVLELQTHKISLERFRLLTSHQQDLLNKILERLFTHEPVQYVLQEADFCGLKFKVNSSVLIPRPETEELVEWVASEFRTTDLGFRILDIGSGSGCIPVSLAKRNSNIIIEGLDISEDALKVAEENSHIHQANVKFKKLDILNENLPDDYYDVIVSNPPYISLSEKNSLAENVLKYEPHLALFATEDDLIFYKRIAEQAAKALKPNGKLFLEINAAKGEEVKRILAQNNFKNIELRKDMSGKDRMVKGER